MARRRSAGSGAQAPTTVFLLSPASLSGERGSYLLGRDDKSSMAQALRSPGGAPLAEVFTFLSGLYFRGKITYARAFGRPPPGLPCGLVISAGDGLRFPDERVDLARLLAWAKVDVDDRNPRFTAPLVRHAEALAAALAPSSRVVLLGSIATHKYVEPLGRVFGERLLFPPDFVGRGDLGRGGLLLKAVREGQELPYAPVLGAKRHGPRAPSIWAGTPVGRGLVPRRVR